MIIKYPPLLENVIGLNEADLVSAARKGDLVAFNQLVILYQDRIFSLALWILGDKDSAENITQNAFLAAYDGLHRFRMGPFHSWLYRIVTNACSDELRRRKKHPLQSLEYDDGKEARLSPVYDLPCPNTLPEKEYERLDVEQAAQQALSRLDADQRAVVVLVDFQDLDYQEAAQILRVPIGTVKSRLARSRLRLRNLLITLLAPNSLYK